MKLNRHAPIGVFDSGLGGLTIVKALRERLPDERIIYLGDTAHLPYGDKEPERVQEYSRRITRFLREQQVKTLVIACNTASAVAYPAVKEEAGDIPVFEVIRPAVDAAIQASNLLRIGVIGTRTTIQSGVYGRTLVEASRRVQVIQKATPLLVPMIEEGWLHNQVSQDVIDAYMSDTGFADIDTLILGCTHYPLIKDQIERYFRENYDHAIALIDSSIAVSESIHTYLNSRDLLAEKRTGEDRFYLTDYSPHFRETAGLFLGQEVEFEAVSV